MSIVIYSNILRRNKEAKREIKMRIKHAIKSYRLVHMLVPYVGIHRFPVFFFFRLSSGILCVRGV